MPKILLIWCGIILVEVERNHVLVFYIGAEGIEPLPAPLVVRRQKRRLL